MAGFVNALARIPSFRRLQERALVVVEADIVRHGLGFGRQGGDFEVVAHILGGHAKFPGGFLDALVHRLRTSRRGGKSLPFA